MYKQVSCIWSRIFYLDLLYNYLQIWIHILQVLFFKSSNGSIQANFELQAFSPLTGPVIIGFPLDISEGLMV